jgi:ABC-type Fe3+/spermidine/putrescine transport system ATPase subunit
LYERPASPFVAGFIGQSNLIAGRLDGAAQLLADDGGPIALAGHYRDDGRATLAVRPESIRLAPPGAAGGRVEGTVKLCTYLGAVLEHVVRLDSGRDIIVRGPGLGPDAAVRWAPDERVSLNWSAAAERVFDDRDQPAAKLAGDATIMTEQGERAWAATR